MVRTILTAVVAATVAVAGWGLTRAYSDLATRVEASQVRLAEQQDRLIRMEVYQQSLIQDVSETLMRVKRIESQLER